MSTLEVKSKTYTLDDDGSLVDPMQWDEDFAEAMAPRLGIPDGLTPSHWNVLKFIRKTYLETGTCPIIHKTCKLHKLGIKDMERLFPSGYQRGACKLAGVSFMANGVCAPFTPTLKIAASRVTLEKRVYRVNVQGFLIDPKEWDEDYATCKAGELLIQGALTDKHWGNNQVLALGIRKEGRGPYGLFYVRGSWDRYRRTRAALSFRLSSWGRKDSGTEVVGDFRDGLALVEMEDIAAMVKTCWTREKRRSRCSLSGQDL